MLFASEVPFFSNNRRGSGRQQSVVFSHSQGLLSEMSMEELSTVWVIMLGWLRTDLFPVIVVKWGIFQIVVWSGSSVCKMVIWGKSIEHARDELSTGNDHVEVVSDWQHFGFFMQMLHL